MSDDKVNLPTQKEIESLPRWARVAFTARCARRVQPLFEANCPDAPQEHIAAVDTAITVAEHASAATDDDNAYVLPGDSYLYAAGSSAAQCVAVAAIAAGSAVAGSCAGVDLHGDAGAGAAVAACAAVRASVGASAESSILSHMRRDFELLRIAAEREAWTDDTPVPPEFFGPLWSEGVPEGWPVQEETSDGCELVFEIDVPEGTSDEELHEKVLELVGRADDLHRAHGGNGLKVKSVEVHDEVPVREGACS